MKNYILKLTDCNIIEKTIKIKIKEDCLEIGYRSHLIS